MDRKDSGGGGVSEAKGPGLRETKDGICIVVMMVMEM